MRNQIIFGLTLAALLLAACGGEARPNPTSPGDPPVAAAATFADVYGVISSGCSCHLGPAGAGDLALPDRAAAYAALVSKPASGACRGAELVTAGRSADSVLWRKVSGVGLCGSKMPLGGTLDPVEVELIQSWIDAGARND